MSYYYLNCSFVTSRMGFPGPSFRQVRLILARGPSLKAEHYSPPSIYKTLLTLVLQKSSIYCVSALHATTFPTKLSLNLEAQQKITTGRSNVTAIQTGTPSNQAVWNLGFPLLPTVTLINYSSTSSWDVSLWVLTPLVNQNIQSNNRWIWMLLVPLRLRERLRQTSVLGDGCVCVCVRCCCCC